MSLLVRLSVAGTVGLLLAACGPREEPVQLVEPTPPVSGASAPAVAPQAPEAAPAVDELRRDFRHDKYSTITGEVVDGRLVNNGKDGYLLFGPYVAFQPGAYSVAFVGSVDELPSGAKVQVDVVSDKGKTRHALVELDAAGSVPSFEFTLGEQVPDLEIRVAVPEGGRVSLESYQVAKLP